MLGELTQNAQYVHLISLIFTNMLSNKYMYDMQEPNILNMDTKWAI